MAHIIILAGGKGTRMKSDTPKVLSVVKGTPIIHRLLESISSLCARPTIIVGYKADEVRAATQHAYQYVEQKEQLGTGHAILIAREELLTQEGDTIIVLPGDHPLVRAETLQNMLAFHNEQQAVVTLATTIAPDFNGEYSLFTNYGRVIRGVDSSVDKIVEYKDASEAERACREVNLSYYCFNAKWLWANIIKLHNHNAASEYYLTDMIKIAKDQGNIVAAFPIQNLVECLGINTPEQLRLVEEAIEQEDKK
jgi:UDP-N-acetylglucosamine diphosphorylase/glucosamine-1-phosphate N-acetyltransferase